MNMIAKGISQDDFPKNWVGRWANMIVSESSLTNSPRRVVPYFYQHFVSLFSRITSFVLKMIFFSYMAYASMRELVRTRDMGMGM